MADADSLISLTPHELLSLVGRLDDAPGFDTARERFRRFLLDHSGEISLFRRLITAWLQIAGDQPRRALQDVVIALGQALGFETAFAPYQPAGGTTVYYGHWRSRHRLRVVLDARLERTPRPSLETLGRTVSALSAGSSGTPVTATSDERLMGISIVAAAESAHAEDANPELRVFSVQTLLTLADMVTSGRLSHEQLVHLLLTSKSIDFVVGLIHPSPMFSAGAVHTASPNPPIHRDDVGYWVAALGRNGAATPDQVLDTVITKRHVLAVTSGNEDHAVPAAGDHICFLVAERGIVGDARVTMLDAGGARLVRGSDRFDRVIGVDEIRRFDTPVSLGGLEHLRQWAATQGRSGTVLMPVSHEEFRTLTTPHASAPALTPGEAGAGVY